MKYALRHHWMCALATLALLAISSPDALPATDVSGTIGTSTTWTLANSPYNIAAYTRLSYGATLTIEPGVLVNGKGRTLEIFGTLNAHGNDSSRIVFTNIAVAAGQNTASQPFSIIARYAHFIRSKIHARTGNAVHGHLTLEDSYIESITEGIYLPYPNANCAIRRNIFVEGNAPSYATLLSVGTSGTNRVFIYDNVFYHSGVCVDTWAAANSSLTIVAGNSFLKSSFPTLTIREGFPSANMLATNNYWGTLNTNIIDRMIFDRNDTTNSANYIRYLPILSSPTSTAAHVPPPTIQAHPQDQTVLAGKSASFNIQAAGLSPITFQWQANGTNLPGQTSPTLTLTNIQFLQPISISAIVRNFAGHSITSQVAYLSVQHPPAAVVILPTNQVAAVAQSVTFDTAVTGAPPLWFQWQFNGTNIADATNTSLTLTNVQTTNAGVYTVLVTNAGGAAISQPASLDVRYVLLSVNDLLVTNTTHAVSGTSTIALMTGFKNGSIFYTTDGSEPTFESAFYTQPFTVDRTTVIRALAYSADFAEFGQAPPITVRVVGYCNLITSSGGGGSVSVNPAAGPYLEDTVVTLTATPDPGWFFLEWSGDVAGTSNIVEVIMTGDKTVKATFGTTLTTIVTGNGTVSLDPAATLYPYGTVIRLSAIPQPGSYFGVWGSAASGTTNPLYFKVNTPNPAVSSLFATLPADKVALTVVPHAGGRVSVTPRANSYTVGSTVSITTLPDTDHAFLNWSGDATGKENPLTITLQQSTIIEAFFIQAPKLSLTPNTDTNGAPHLRITLMGLTNMPYRFDTSTNLKDWSEWTTLTNMSGSIHLWDQTYTNAPQRFYRAILP